MSKEEILQAMKDCGALLVDDHFVYTSGRHGSVYVNKDAIYPFVELVSDFCKNFAIHFLDTCFYGIDVVAAPAVGGIILSQWTAYWLETFTSREVLAIFAEKTEDGNRFVFRRGYDKFMKDKRVLVVEDVITTGGSVKKVVEAVRALDGNVLAVGAIWNRGGVTAQDIANVPELFSLIDQEFESWDEAECPLCVQGVPINTEVGKGKEYLARKAQTK